MSRFEVSAENRALIMPADVQDLSKTITFRFVRNGVARAFNVTDFLSSFSTDTNVFSI